MNGRGLLLDPPGHAYTSARHLLGFAPPVARQVSLRGHAPRVRNQGATNGCTGFASRCAVMTRCSYLGTPIEEVSPQGIYTVGRRIDTVGPDDPILDTGAQPNEIVRGIQVYGVTSEEVWPFDPASINASPTLGQLEALATLTGAYAITDGDTTALAAALTAGIPVCAATYAESFEDYNGGAPILEPPSFATPDHYVTITGFDTSASGSRVFEFQNSWGDGWGAEGYGYGSERWARRLVALMVFDVKRAQGVAQ